MEIQHLIYELLSLNPLKTRKSFRLLEMMIFLSLQVGLNPLKTRKSFRLKERRPNMAETKES